MPKHPKIKRLTAKQRDRLSDFLASTPDNINEMTLSQVHGFLTAVISGPEMIPPSDWMLHIWGEPEWATAEEAQDYMGMLMQLYNEIVYGLFESKKFLPLFDIDGDNDRLDPTNWCRGYVKGMQVNAGELWTENEEGELGELLTPIFFFIDDEPDWQRLRRNKEYWATATNDIPLVAIRIYEYWLEQRRPRKADLPASSVETRTVGRNEPCPCDSGKKYKHCCGDPANQN